MGKICSAIYMEYKNQINHDEDLHKLSIYLFDFSLFLSVRKFELARSQSSSLIILIVNKTDDIHLIWSQPTRMFVISDSVILSRRV